ncbi:MAG: DUF1501 domain-containing protein [Planctomycetota bacterium]|jgi:uncharacterized protein (DUF1501 family)
MKEIIRKQATEISRRGFHGIGATAAASVVSPKFAIAKPPTVKGRAQACVLIWLGGGMCHVDTLDPKAIGDPQSNRAGSAYSAIDTAIPGVQVCEHLSRTASLLDRGVLIRSLNHPLKVDHADSTNLVKTGRLPSGTVVYPSLGSLISHQRGRRADSVPPYVVMGYPNVTRGPGFLGSRYGYFYLTDAESGLTGLKRPFDVSEARQARRTELLGLLRNRALGRDSADATLADYDAVIEDARKLMHGPFSKAFDITSEKPVTRERYGSEFGQRCLLARRLVESGVRFVEVAYDLNFKNGTGWDTHRHGQKQQHLLIQDLDAALSALIEDLELRGLLDETLIVVATEFGRPPEFDGQGGRGHQSAAFSTALFGAGLRTGQVIGATDDLGRKVVERPVSVPDFHATILAAMGIDPAIELYDGDRPIPITDHGKVIDDLFA